MASMTIVKVNVDYTDLVNLNYSSNFLEFPLGKCGFDPSLKLNSP